MACPPSTERVLLLGDSLAVGLDPRLAKLASGCHVPYEAVVKGGTGVLYWRPKIEALLADHRPTAVLISLGGNDYWRMEGDTDQGGAAVRKAIPELVDTLRAAGVRPLWIRWLIPIRDRPGVDAAWRQTGVEYFDTEPLHVPRGKGDPYHPSPQGFDTLASALWDWTAARLGAGTGPAPPAPPPPSPRRPLGLSLLVAGVGVGVGYGAVRALERWTA